MQPRLSPLQLDILRALLAVEPPWVLTGGGALAGAWLKHRETRDLDLFWHGLDKLGDLTERIADRLRDEGFTVSSRERATSFARFAVTRGAETTVLDLVADPTPLVQPPVRVEFDSMQLLVDARREIFVNKLNALLSRSELRDLIDLRALMAGGEPLDEALQQARIKDGGFSSLTLAWVLEQMPIRALARGSNVSAEEAAALELFRDQLVRQLQQMTRP